MPQVNIYTKPGAIPADVQLRAYVNPICPYAQRVRLFAAAKGITTEEINIHLQVKPDWYVNEVNPDGKGKVPAIQLHDGRIIIESLIAAEYIDEAFGGKKLWPTDPFLKAQGRLIIDRFGNRFTPHFYKNYRDQDSNDHNVELARYLETLEEKLGQNAFFSGEEPGAVDYLIWPWFERIGALQTLRPAFAEVINRDKFPQIFSWIDRMKETDAVKQSYLPTENHVAFMKSLFGGSPDYGTADVTGKGVNIYTKEQ